MAGNFAAFDLILSQAPAGSSNCRLPSVSFCTWENPLCQSHLTSHLFDYRTICLMRRLFNMWPMLSAPSPFPASLIIFFIKVSSLGFCLVLRCSDHVFHWFCVPFCPQDTGSDWTPSSALTSWIPSPVVTPVSGHCPDLSGWRNLASTVHVSWLSSTAESWWHSSVSTFMYLLSSFSKFSRTHHLL